MLHYFLYPVEYLDNIIISFLGYFPGKNTNVCVHSSEGIPLYRSLSAERGGFFTRYNCHIILHYAQWP